MQNFLTTVYTVVNFIDGGTTLLFSTFDKTQYVMELKCRKRLLNCIFIGIVPTKSPFSQKVLRKYEQKICHFLSLKKWFIMTYSMTPYPL